MFLRISGSSSMTRIFFMCRGKKMGSFTVTVVPHPNLLFTCTRRRCSCTQRFTSSRPEPGAWPGPDVAASEESLKELLLSRPRKFRFLGPEPCRPRRCVPLNREAHRRSPVPSISRRYA